MPCVMLVEDKTLISRNADCVTLAKTYRMTLLSVMTGLVQPSVELGELVTIQWS